MGVKEGSGRNLVLKGVILTLRVDLEWCAFLCSVQAGAVDSHLPPVKCRRMEGVPRWGLPFWAAATLFSLPILKPKA